MQKIREVKILIDFCNQEFDRFVINKKKEILIIKFQFLGNIKIERHDFNLFVNNLTSKDFLIFFINVKINKI